MLQDILHPVIDEEEKDDKGASTTEAKGSKAPAKKEDPKKAAKAPAKGGKGAAAAEVAAYESPLALTTSGVESIVIMVDQMFETLPIESLRVFKQVAVTSRDFNLHLHL